MELKWLEDFLSLADSGSFSRSADLRHITQSAFSRRIRALEAWLGVALVDRSTYPTRLTPAGETFKSAATDLVSRLHAARAQARGQVADLPETIRFAVPHTLAFAFLPAWLAQVRREFGPLNSRLVAGNVHDAVMALVEGGCDLLVCYHHAAHPISLDPARFEGIRLGVETVRPYAPRTADDRPRWQLPGTSGVPLPFLGYGANAYLRRVVDTLIERNAEAPHLALSYETDMAESLKAMMLAGHGLAFLPASSVARELERGEVVVAGDERWSIDMDVCLYRDRNNTRPPLDRLWRHLTQVG